MKDYKIYLDDERMPKSNGWIICRNYQDFVYTIKNHGLPTMISFDHDIASFDENGDELTGFDAAKFITEYCMDNDLKCPDFNVHSANPVGSMNINGLLLNFQSYQRKIER